MFPSFLSFLAPAFHPSALADGPASRHTHQIHLFMPCWASRSHRGSAPAPPRPARPQTPHTATCMRPAAAAQLAPGVVQSGGAEVQLSEATPKFLSAARANEPSSLTHPAPRHHEGPLGQARPPWTKQVLLLEDAVPSGRRRCVFRGEKGDWRGGAQLSCLGPISVKREGKGHGSDS